MLLVLPLALQVRRSPKAMSIRSSHTWSAADLFQEARSGFRLNRCSAYGPVTPCDSERLAVTILLRAAYRSGLRPDIVLAMTSLLLFCPTAFEIAHH